MGMHLSTLPGDSKQVQYLKKLLLGIQPEYIFPNEPNNKTGQAKGRLIGGNMSVIMGLRGSEYDLKYRNAILFIEDVGEKPYQIDRMIQNLRLSGILAKISGLIIGQFSECEEDPLMMQSVQELILSAVNEYGYPVCFNFPAGHVEYNLPFILGGNIDLLITKDRTELIF
jgi:muramoyltetrapeptide carboxypeptidase